MRALPMLRQPTEAPPAVAWMQVLDQIQEKIGVALAHDAEANLPTFPPIADATPLPKLEERLTLFEASLNQADTNAAQIDAALETEAEHLQRRLENLRQ